MSWRPLVSFVSAVLLAALAPSSFDQGQRLRAAPAAARLAPVAAAQQAPLDAQPPADPAAQRSRYVAITLDDLPTADAAGQTAADQSAARAVPVVLDLFEDLSVVAIFDRFDPNPRGVTWVGHVAGVEDSTVTLVYGDGVMTGNVLMPTATYTIRPAPDAVRAATPLPAGQLHVAAQIDPSTLPPGAPPIEVVIPDAAPMSADVAFLVESADFIDVMVVYTPAAVTHAGGLNSLLNKITLNVSETNTSYASSGVMQRLRLAHTVEVAYTDTSSMNKGLEDIRYGRAGFEAIPGLRNAYAADVVVLVHHYPGSGYCGLGYVMTSPSLSFAPWAYNVVAANCMNTAHTFAHELGHNMGLQHDWYMNNSLSPYTYAHGHVNTGTTTATRWRTIMAYGNRCTQQGFSCQYLLRWSNPTLLWNGAPMGVPAGTNASCTTGSTLSNTCDADERQALNNTAPFVANFRQGAPMEAPAGFSKSSPANGVSIGAVSQVTLSWQPSAGATSYQYCYDTIDNQACDTSWLSAGSSTSVQVNGLSAGATYHWQVRAATTAVTTQANSGTWWTFDATGAESAAAYDPHFKAPRCTVVGGICHSGTLLNGSGTMSGGAEPNRPNTLFSSCSDGSLGTYHVDESIDRLRVRTLDGTPFAPGKTVRIDATVWAYSATQDSLDLYYTANANTPAWTHITTIKPTTTGAHTMSANYTLPSGSVQAIRARFRYQGSQSPCGQSGYDDHDDLVFAVGMPAGSDLVVNGTFSTSVGPWQQHATPTPDHVVSNVSGGVLQFYRQPASAGATSQAAVFQPTGQLLPAQAPIRAQFDLGNSDNVRKRISVLVHDADFSDLSVCTFWLPPNAPLATYTMRARTTKAWTNATISFYAATVGSNGGFYRVDNVSVRHMPADPADRTACGDPLAPAAADGAAGPDLLVNGTFNTGSLSPWGLAGTITQRIAGGVFEFTRPTNNAPAGVVLQGTNQPMTAGQILTSTFQLGNSSAVRKRVTVVMHEADFSDLTACTFWLAPGQSLSTYTYRTYTTKAWTNATLSIYPSTVGAEQWIRLDNVTLRRTPGTATLGTECLEPGAAADAQSNGGWTTTSDASAPPQDTAGEHLGSLSNDDWLAAGFARVDDGAVSTGWVTAANDGRAQTLQLAQPIDLSDATSATLRLTSWLSAIDSRASVQISLDGITWEIVHLVTPSDTWIPIDIDLAAYLGHEIHVRFVFDAVTPAPGAQPDIWRIEDVQIDIFP